MTETVFALPGLAPCWSNPFFRAIIRWCRVYLIIAVIFVVINLLVDLSYAYLDPRVRLE